MTHNKIAPGGSDRTGRGQDGQGPDGPAAHSFALPNAPVHPFQLEPRKYINPAEGPRYNRVRVLADEIFGDRRDEPAFNETIEAAANASDETCSEQPAEPAPTPDGPWMPTEQQMAHIGRPLGLSGKRVKELLSETYLWQGPSLFNENGKNLTNGDFVRARARELKALAENPDEDRWTPTAQQMAALGEPLGLTPEQVQALLSDTWTWSGPSLFREHFQDPTVADVVRMAARELKLQEAAAKEERRRQAEAARAKSKGLLKRRIDPRLKQRIQALLERMGNGKIEGDTKRSPAPKSEAKAEPKAKSEAKAKSEPKAEVQGEAIASSSSATGHQVIDLADGDHISIGIGEGTTPGHQVIELADADHISINLGEGTAPQAPEAPPEQPTQPPPAGFSLPSMQQVLAWVGLGDVPPVPEAFVKDLEQAAANITANLLNLGGGAPTGVPATDLAQLAHAYGTDLNRLRSIAAAGNGLFVPSASAGEDLKSLNDHVGVLILPMPDGTGSTVATRLAVVKAHVPAAGGQNAADKYFVKGYDNKLLDIEQLQSAIQVHTSAPPGAPGPNLAALQAAQAPVPAGGGQGRPLMETPFLSTLRIISDSSSLWARRTDEESGAVTMSEPHNAPARARKEGWANSEAFLSPGAGPMLPNGTRKFQLDFNSVENRLMIFRNENGAARDGTGGPARLDAVMSEALGGNVKRAPVLLSGPVLAEIKGIKHWELMGPADQHAGIKGGGTKRLISSIGRYVPDFVRNKVFHASELSNYLGSARPGARIIITTDDDAQHELTLSEDGIKMKMLNPKSFGKSGPIFGCGSTVECDLDVYSYRAIDTGPLGSPGGSRIESETAMSTGETFLAAPLVKNRSGVTGSVKVVAESVSRLALRQPGLGNMNHGKVTHLLNTGLSAAMQFATVFASSELNRLAKGEDGKYIEDAESFSAVGSSGITSGQIAVAAATIVVAQEAMTIVFKWMAHLIPDVFKHPEDIGEVLTFTVNAGKEMARQEANFAIQHALRLRPGNGLAEHGMMGLSATALTLIARLHERYGNSANHPHMNALFTTLRQGAYNTFRAGQVALNKPGPHPTTKADFQEAAANRFMTRALDQIVLPVIGIYLNELGLLGPNARAFSRLSNAQSKSWAPRAASALDGAVAKVDKGLSDVMSNLLGEKDFFHWYNLSAEQSKRLLNRVELGLVRMKLAMSKLLPTPAPGGPVPNHAGDLANNVRYAGSYSISGDGTGVPTQLQQALLEDMYDVFKDRVNKSGGPVAPLGRPTNFRPPVTGGFAQGVGMPGAMTNALTELPRAQERFTRKLLSNFPGQARLPNGMTPEDGPFYGPQNTFKPRVEQPLTVGYDNKQYLTYPKRTFNVREPAPYKKVPRDQTTFSFTAQASALRRTKKMEAESGLHTMLESNPLPVSLDGRNVPMTPQIRDRCDLATRQYSVESQDFHYASRWDVTGVSRVEEISPGIKRTYNHISKPGNVKGRSDKFVDPIETVYVNLAAVHSPKFPSEVYRAAVTQAQYRPRQQGEDDDTPGLMSTGDVGVLTEIFSASMETRMAAAFGQGINVQGGAARVTSQRITLAQETGINVTRKTDLTQAEIIMTQGAVLEVVHIDPHAGRDPNAPGAADFDIGQVVYMQQVDTYELEQAYDMIRLPPDQRPTQPFVGAMAIDPDTGHWYEYRPGDPAADAHGLVLRNRPKNYFLGRKLERDDGAAVPQPRNSIARWKEPFTSDEAPRTMKDAIHAAILRNDAIVPMLNDAVLNAHHEHFRRKGGFYAGNVPRQLAEAAQVTANRQRATNVQAATVAQPMNAQLAQGQEQMVAAMLCHLLRERVHLVPIAAGGAVVPGAGALPANTARFDKTFDKVDLVASPLDSKNPKPPITIGVAPDGYYLLRHAGGQWVADTKVDIHSAGPNGRTLGNLMHAVLRAGDLIDLGVGGSYSEVRNPTPGGAANLLQRQLPVTGADRVDQLRQKMARYFLTPYVKLERGLCEMADRINNDLGLMPPQAL